MEKTSGSRTTKIPEFKKKTVYEKSKPICLHFCRFSDCNSSHFILRKTQFLTIHCGIFTDIVSSTCDVSVGMPGNTFLRIVTMTRLLFRIYFRHNVNTIPNVEQENAVFITKDQWLPVKKETFFYLSDT